MSNRRPNWRRAVVGGLLLGAALLLAFVPARPSVAQAANQQSPASVPLGAPLAGLDATLLSAFNEGLDRFQHHFTPQEGLGPIFNEDSCATCHGAGAPGGGDPLALHSIHNVTHFAYDNLGFFDPMRDLGGPLLERQSIRTAVPGCTLDATTVPPLSNILSIRNTPPVFGFGLIDAVPDEEILSRQREGEDGIHGVANWGIELQAIDQQPIPRVPLNDYGAFRVGRFGWKAQTATLQQFSAEPFNTELGVSNLFFPQEHTPNGTKFPKDLPPGCLVALHQPNDIDQSQALALYHFQALLAPPPRAPQTEESREGERLFHRINCQGCHETTLVTGPRYHMLMADGNTVRVPQLENQFFHPYSDLLIHDMGKGLADNNGATIGRVMGRAGGQYWRTTPLWGIRFKNVYLHDGRTDDIREAILQHGGEAQTVRDRYAGLDREGQDAVVAFLNTL